MESGYNPEIILAGRRMNDSMGNYVAQEVIKLMLAKESNIKGGKALIMGITFKENCPDTRNTRVVDVIAALKEYHLEVDVFDPWAKQEQVTAEYGLTVKNKEAELASQYDCIVLAVAHDAFKQIDISKLKGEKSVVFDVKSFLPEAIIDGRL
jgi:UDP-N-acetyl-D-galactosamine dehydrogenase